MSQTVGSARVILRNAGFLLGGNLVTLALSVPFWLVVPRVVGPTSWGEFSLGTSVASLGFSVGGFGVATFLLKEIARDRTRAVRYLRSGLATHFSLSLLMVTGVFGFCVLVGYSQHERNVVLLLTASGVCAFMAGPAVSALQALEKMHLNALVIFLRQLLITGTVVPLALFFRPDILILIVVILAWNVLAAALQLAITNRDVPVGLVFDPEMARKLILGGLPFWSNGVFLAIYSGIGSVLLSILVSTREVGYYSAGLQTIATVGILPTIITTAIFPALSSGYRQDPEHMRRLTRMGLLVLITVGLPISAGAVLVGPNAIETIFGHAYVPAGTTIVILGLTIVPVFISTLAYWVIAAADRQRIWVIVMAVAAVVNAGLNAVAIPYFESRFGHGSVGAAVALLVTESGMCIAGLAIMPRACLTPARPLLVATTRVALATAVMAVVVWFFREDFLLVPILVGVGAFAAAGFVLRAFRSEGLDLAWTGLSLRFRHRLLRRPEPEQAA